MSKSLMGGVDIGGSHITAALVDITTGTLLSHSWQRSAVPAQGTATAIIDAWSKVIAASCAAQSSLPARIGIAMPGPFDYIQGISFIKDQHKYDALYGLNVKELLAAKLGMRPEAIVLTNDAACFLQGEVFAGAAKGYDNVIGLTLGTGLGSATYVSGRVADAGWWNTPFQHSIAEDHLSSRWFTARYQALSGKEVSHVKELVSIDDKILLQTIFDEFGRNLGVFLTPFIREQGATALVIGGNIARSFELFALPLQEQLRSEGIHLLAKAAQLGEQAALVGAATAGLELPMGKAFA